MASIKVPVNAVTYYVEERNLHSSQIQFAWHFPSAERAREELVSLMDNSGPDKTYTLYASVNVPELAEWEKELLS
jgi:hypothetical protein